jgi:hypothetical protein
MKAHHLLLVLLVFLVFSCKKEDDVIDDADPGAVTTLIPSAIGAGQDTGLGVSYVDLDPDSIFTNGPYHFLDSVALDMNADGNIDFMVIKQISDPFMLGAIWRKFDIRPLGDNQVCISAPGSNLVDTLSFNAVIDSSRTWSNAISILYQYSWSMAGNSSTDGYFMNNGPYYVGLRINAGGRAYYGWLYLNHDSIDKYGITSSYEE